MSEQARIAALQEKIREWRDAGRAADQASAVGAVVAGLGFGLYLVSWGGWVALPLGILGLIIVVIGVLLTNVVSVNKKKLMRELESMSGKTPTCRYCGKHTPQGDYTHCPFCGAFQK